MSPWSKEQEQYLRDKWGSVSIPTIAKHLGRTVNAVNLKASRLGLGAMLEAGDYITVNQLCDHLGVSYSYTVKMWQNQGMPIRLKKVINNSFKVVYINDFWRWAEPNKMTIDFSRLKPGALGPEPDWVTHKRKADFLAAQYKTTPWTTEEDKLLIHLLDQYRYSYRDISIELKRTEGALKRRMGDLNLKQRPVKASNHNSWTDEEVATLVGLYYKGYIAEVMAESITRSASAIKGKIERMVNEGELLPIRVDPNVGPERLQLASGVNYKEVLPPEQWPQIELFLNRAHHYADQAKENNMKIDVGSFLAAYVDVYAPKMGKEVC